LINKSIELVILDLDDTLCDTRTAYFNARRHISETLINNKIDPVIFWNRYELLVTAKFQDAIDGKLPWKEYRRLRFLNPLKDFLNSPDELAIELNNIFINEINNKIKLFDDVVPALHEFNSDGIKCALLTNGPSDGQWMKIRTCGLDKHLKSIFISEELGCAKPDCEVFNAVLREMGIEPAHAMMIGDSHENDVAGAINSGIMGILIDRFGDQADYLGHRITSLKEVICHDID
jgi:putative hydrolase of the HAD superfamily